MSSYGRVLLWGQNALKEQGIQDWKLDAWYLMEAVTGFDRGAYFLRSDEEMKQADQEKYQSWIERRGQHVPLQHLTGEAWFMGHRFLVNDKVLIPRQDTETLVEEACKVVEPGMQLLDMCTGSGCILLSLLAECGQARGVGVDISPEALEVAAKNGSLLEAEGELAGGQVEWLQSDVFEKVTGKFSVIVSNPPYIPTETIKGLMPEVREHDPMLALDGHEDGLYFYRKIISQAGEFLEPGGFLFFEIGYDQGEAVSALLEQYKFTEIGIIKDLAGLDRVVKARRGQ